MFAVLDILDNKGLRFCSSVWVAYERLPYGSSTCGTCVVLTLFAQGVSTLM